MDRAAQWASDGNFADHGDAEAVPSNAQRYQHPHQHRRTRSSFSHSQGNPSRTPSGARHSQDHAHAAYPAVHFQASEPSSLHSYYTEQGPRSVSSQQTLRPNGVPDLTLDTAISPNHGHHVFPTSTMSAHLRRMGTNLGNDEEAHVEVRHTHNYVFRRPRPLMVEHRGHVMAVGDNQKIDVKHPENSYHLDVHAQARKRGVHHPDSLAKQRERLDIFVDLVWVGIIANIAEHFHAQVFYDGISSSQAMGEFLLLFIPAWRIWYSLQQFLNCFYTADALQRFFVMWIMILGAIWGNNAPWLLLPADDETRRDNWTIVTYLVAMGSFSLMHAFYAFWLPYLRRYSLLSFLGTIPNIALWIGAACVPPGPTKLILIAIAVSLNTIELFAVSSPFADRLLGNGIREAQDLRTLIRRYENFFIIALGEGVFLLIRESPLVDLAVGFVSIHLARGILVLVLFYMLNWVYFHGDLSKRYVHAMDRRWWIRTLWQAAHVPLFAALVILSSGTVYLITYPSDQDDPEHSSALENEASEGSLASSLSTHKVRGARSLLSSLLPRATEESGSGHDYSPTILYTATAVTCICVSVSLFCFLILAFLNRPVDKSGTLKVGSRFVRMAPRAVAALILSVAWLAPGLQDPTVALGLNLALVMVVAALEQLLGMPKEARLFEPKEAAVADARKVGRSESDESRETV